MRNGFNFTKEHLKFVKEITEGRSNQEITDMFNKKFGTYITREQIVGLKNRNEIKGSLDDRVRPAKPVKKVAKDSGIPKYVYESLRRYGNTIIAKRIVNKLGGEEAVIELLKNEGLDCSIEEPTEQVTYYEGKRKVTLDHYVVREKRETKKTSKKQTKKENEMNEKKEEAAPSENNEGLIDFLRDENYALYHQTKEQQIAINRLEKALEKCCRILEATVRSANYDENDGKIQMHYKEFKKTDEWKEWSMKE